MGKISCGRAAVEALRAVGVTKVFGLMGSSTLEMYDALYDAKDMAYVGVRHENCGAHMADAYARV
ncbi:MAG: sulfoacetaldehyde acetyltransferase, partial [Burkholderiales bacterium]|nr:sulfoacetaldehyde acetyltransferase [Burkholderiales bacterium]